MRDMEAAAESVAQAVSPGVSALIPVTELLHRAGETRHDAIAELIRALERRDLRVQPAADAAERWHTLRITHPDDAAGDRGETAHYAVLHNEIQPCDPHEADVLWVDVAAGDLDNAEFAALIEGLIARTEVGVEPADVDAIVADLLEPDFRPSTHVFGTRSVVRTLSCFSVSAREADDGSADKSGRLDFQLVEFLAGPGWILTVRFHGDVVDPRRVHREALEGSAVAALNAERLYERTLRRWKRAREAEAAPATHGAGDVGVLVFHELIDSYHRSLRLIESWLTQWELEAADPGIETERETLSSMLVLLNEFRSRIAPLARPYRGDPVAGWFPDVHDGMEAKYVLELVTDAIEEIDRLLERTRAAVEMLEGIRGDERSRKMERYGFILLFPALVTGFFGMNTWLPDSGHPHPITFLVIVICTIVATLTIQRRWTT